MEENKISVEELQEILKEDKPVYIIDVRPDEQHEEWNIPESHHINVYDELKNGRKDMFDDRDLPEDRPIVTVCDAGVTSGIAAEVLTRKGYQTYSLDGGMKAWNYAWNTAELTIQDRDIRIIQVRRSAKGCLSYLIGSAGDAIVIDASLDPAIYLALAREQGWKIRHVMDTHIHADYLSRTGELAVKSGATRYFSALADVEYPYVPLRNGQKLSFGSAETEVIYSPGHTPESICLLISGNVLLTGDTLFTDGVGRPDLKASKEEGLVKADQLYDSLQQILRLPGNTLILPAHYSDSVPFSGKMIYETLSTLKKNLELLNLPKETFKNSVLEKIPPPPPNYSTIVHLNKKGEFDGHQPAELEAGANRCAVS